MYRVEFQLGCFDESEGLDRNSLQRIINAMCVALTAANIEWLRVHPEAPLLLESGVRYVPEPPQEEWFADIPTVLRRGWGDCDDLGCWRAAELVVRYDIGDAHTFTQRQVEPDGSTVYHVMVTSSLGTEDPSSALGMNWR